MLLYCFDSTFLLGYARWDNFLKGSWIFGRLVDLLEKPYDFFEVLWFEPTIFLNPELMLIISQDLRIRMTPLASHHGSIHL